jgi:hypothetical protein
MPIQTIRDPKTGEERRVYVSTGGMGTGGPPKPKPQPRPPAGGGFMGTLNDFNPMKQIGALGTGVSTFMQTGDLNKSIAAASKEAAPTTDLGRGANQALVASGQSLGRTVAIGGQGAVDIARTEIDRASRAREQMAAGTSPLDVQLPSTGPGAPSAQRVRLPEWANYDDIRVEPANLVEAGAGEILAILPYFVLGKGSGVGSMTRMLPGVSRLAAGFDKKVAALEAGNRLQRFRGIFAKEAVEGAVPGAIATYYGAKLTDKTLSDSWLAPVVKGTPFEGIVAKGLLTDPNDTVEQARIKKSIDDLIWSVPLGGGIGTGAAGLNSLKRAGFRGIGAMQSATKRAFADVIQNVIKVGQADQAVKDAATAPAAATVDPSVPSAGTPAPAPAPRVVSGKPAFSSEVYGALRRQPLWETPGVVIQPGLEPQARAPQPLPVDSYTPKLNYSDVNPAAGPLNASGKRYAQALAGQDQIAIEVTSQKLRASFNNAAAKLGIELGPNANSQSWSMWDIGKQLYMDANPAKSNKPYVLGNPLTNIQVQADIVDRALGFEITKGVDVEGKRYKSWQLTEIGRKAREEAGVELGLVPDPGSQRTVPAPAAPPTPEAAAAALQQAQSELVAATQRLQSEAAKEVVTAPEVAAVPQGQLPGMNQPAYEQVATVPTGDVVVAPKVFQYKAEGQTATGRSGSLAEENVYDPRYGGVISVWRDTQGELGAPGQIYVVNGHNRLELANRSGFPVVNVQYIDAPTAADARMTGALQNIKDDKGTAIDAAKIFRDTGMSVEDLRLQNVNLNGKLAAEGVALSRIPQWLFDKTATGDLPTAKAVALGSAEGIDDAIISDVAKQAIAGKWSAEKIVQAMQEAKFASTATAPVEGTLPGFEDMFKTTNVVNLIDIRTAAYKQLSVEMRALAAASQSKNTSYLEAAGNAINVEGSQAARKMAAEAVAVFNRVTGYEGPVRDLLNELAAQLPEGAGRTKAAANLVQFNLQRLRDAISEEMNGPRLLQDEAVVQQVAAAEPAAPRAQAELPDARGQGEFYHGAAKEISQLDEGYYENANIYGQGFYVTDDLKTAGSYTKKNAGAVAKEGGTPGQVIYRVAESQPVNFYDLDAPVAPSVREYLEQASEWSEATARALDELDADPGTSLAKVMDEIRANSRSAGESRDTVQEVFEGLRETLEGEGYGGFTHVGGKLTKTGREHQVRIYWNAQNQLNLEKYSPGASAAEPAPAATGTKLSQQLRGQLVDLGQSLGELTRTIDQQTQAREQRLVERTAELDAEVQQVVSGYADPLEAENLADARQFLGLPATANVAQVARVAKQEGYDGIVFTGDFGLPSGKKEIDLRSLPDVKAPENAGNPAPIQAKPVDVAAAPAERPLVKPGAELSHGTSETARKSILAEGFRASEYERSGTVAGEGVYMTPSERYAGEYGSKRVGGALPEDAKILNWTGSDQTLASLADEIGIAGPRELNKSANEVELNQVQQQQLKQWALDNGYDGIQYRTNFTPGGKAQEVVIYNIGLANRIVGSRAAAAPTGAITPGFTAKDRAAAKAGGTKDENEAISAALERLGLAEEAGDTQLAGELGTWLGRRGVAVQPMGDVAAAAIEPPVAAIDIPEAAGRKITAKTDQNRVRVAAESLQSWGSVPGRDPIPLEQALDLVRTKGAILDPDRIPGLDVDAARNSKAMGRTTVDTEAVARAYKQFYDFSAELPNLEGWRNVETGSGGTVGEGYTGVSRITEREANELARVAFNISGVTDFRIQERIEVTYGPRQARAYGDMSLVGRKAEIAGSYRHGKAMADDTITVAMSVYGAPKSFTQMMTTTYHESMHRLMRWFFTSAENLVLARSEKGLREMAAMLMEGSLQPNKARAYRNGTIKMGEVISDAFAAYMRGITLPKVDLQGFAKLKNYIDQSINYILSGGKYKTWDDVFEKAALGEFQGRGGTGEPGVEFAADPPDPAEFARRIDQNMQALESGDLTPEEIAEMGASDVRRITSRSGQTQYVPEPPDVLIASNKALGEMLTSRAQQTGIGSYSQPAIVKAAMDQLDADGWAVESTTTRLEAARRGDPKSQEDLIALAANLIHRDSIAAQNGMTAIEWQSTVDEADRAVLMQRLWSGLEDQHKLDTALMTASRKDGQRLSVMQIKYDFDPTHRQVPSGTPMYHGTTEAAAQGIVEGGFKDTDLRSNLLGTGAYFTESPQGAAAYGDVVAGGDLPSDVRILDLVAMDKRIADLVQELNLGALERVGDNLSLTDGQRAAVRDWAAGQGYSGIRFSPDFELGGGAPETVIFDVNVANRVVGSKAAVEPEIPVSSESMGTDIDDEIANPMNTILGKIDPDIRADIEQGVMSPEATEMTEIAAQVAISSRSVPGMRAKLNSIVGKIDPGRLNQEMFLQAYRAALLWSPKTWTKMLVGSTYRAVTMPINQAIAETGAAGIAALKGDNKAAYRAMRQAGSGHAHVRQDCVQLVQRLAVGWGIVPGW